MTNYKDTFKGTARYYARYREGYPEEFFDLLGSKFGLTKSDRILDLGCGTGQIAIQISGFVREVVAMDPEPEMIAEGKKQASAGGVKNITWIEGGSEDLPGMRYKPGHFKLATVGTAFHWMDREKTLEEFHRIVTDGGGVVVVSGTSIWTEPVSRWQTEVKALIRKYLGEERRAGSGVFRPPERMHEEVIRESSFGRMEIWKRRWTRCSTLDEVTGSLYSTSMANPSVLGEKKEAFESELRGLLRRLESPEGFKSEGILEAILLWK